MGGGYVGVDASSSTVTPQSLTPSRTSVSSQPTIPRAKCSFTWPTDRSEAQPSLTDGCTSSSRTHLPGGTGCAVNPIAVF
jgi:hypothetical protein